MYIDVYNVMLSEEARYEDEREAKNGRDLKENTPRYLHKFSKFK